MRVRVLVCLVMLLGVAGVASAGNNFNGSVNGDWSNVGNWDMAHVPENSTTDPGSYVPQWGNDCGVTTNAAMVIGTGENHASYSLQIGLYGADNASVTMNGGTLTVGNWGMDVGRGNSNDHGTGSGLLTMTGGLINIGGNLVVSQEWRNSGVLGTITGVVNMSGGVINAPMMRIGMYDGPGTINLSGTAVMNLSNQLQMNTGWGGWGEPDACPSAELNILGGAALNIIGGGTPELVAAEMQHYQDYIDLGWIHSGADVATMSYNAQTNIIRITPEPATMLLLGLGGLLLRRKP